MSATRASIMVTLIVLSSSARIGWAASPATALITATQAEYEAYELVTILGYEFQPGQDILVKITSPDGSIVDAGGKRNRVDTVEVGANGMFSYQYPLENLAGLYRVEGIDAATVGNGNDRWNEVVLAETFFADSISTDLELVGMPDAVTRPRSASAAGRFRNMSCGGTLAASPRRL
jgi:hypothetical protein